MESARKLSLALHCIGLALLQKQKKMNFILKIKVHILDTEIRNVYPNQEISESKETLHSLLLHIEWAC